MKLTDIERVLLEQQDELEALAVYQVSYDISNEKWFLSGNG